MQRIERQAKGTAGAFATTGSNLIIGEAGPAFAPPIPDPGRLRLWARITAQYSDPTIYSFVQVRPTESGSADMPNGLTGEFNAKEAGGNTAVPFGAAGVGAIVELVESDTMDPVGGVQYYEFTYLPADATFNNVVINNSLSFGIFILTNITNNVTLDVTGKSKLAIGNSANRTINGFSGGVPGQILIIWNTGAFALTLAHLAGNIRVPLAVNYVVWPSDGVLLQYDGTSWRFDHPTLRVRQSTGSPSTYALRDLLIDTGLVYTDNADGSGTLAVDSGALGAGARDFFYRQVARAGAVGSSVGGVGSPSSFKRYQVAGLYGAQVTSNVSFGPYVMFAMPLPRPRGGTIGEVGIYVDVAASIGTKLCAAAIYSNIDDTDPYPNALLADLGVVDISTTGKKFFPDGLPLVLVPGKLYWMCLWPSSLFDGRSINSAGSLDFGAWGHLGFEDIDEMTAQVGWKFGNSQTGAGLAWDYDVAAGVWPSPMTDDGNALVTLDIENLPAIFIFYSA